MVTAGSLLNTFLNPEPISCPIQGSNSCFLTCIQVYQETGNMVWYSHLFKCFPQFVMINTVKGFSIVDGPEVDAFLVFPCFLYDPTNVCNLISLPFLNSACTSGSFQLALSFGIGIIDLFQTCGHCWVFQICWNIEGSNLPASSLGFEIAQRSSITATSFVHSNAS